MLEKIFKLKEKNTNVKTELIAGLTTFLAMAYILGVNPAIFRRCRNGYTLCIHGNCNFCGICFCCYGACRKLSSRISSGMGVNALFAYTVVSEMGYSWQAALAAVLVSGIVF